MKDVLLFCVMAGMYKTTNSVVLKYDFLATSIALQNTQLEKLREPVVCDSAYRAAG